MIKQRVKYVSSLYVHSETCNKREREKREEWNKVNTMSICLQVITKYSESCFVLLKSRNRSLYIVKKKN